MKKILKLLNSERLLARRPDILLTAAMALAALVALGIFKLASEIAEGELNAYDTPGLHWVRAIFGESSGMRAAMLDLTALGDVTTLTLVVVFSAGLLMTLKRGQFALFLVAQCVSGALVMSLLKVWFGRARPTVVEHWASYGSASFPSGHAANSAIVYLSIAILVAGLAPSRSSRIYVAGAAGLLVMLIGISRVYLGVHWPSDVLAGWAFGGGWALMCWSIMWRMAPLTARAAINLATFPGRRNQ